MLKRGYDWIVSFSSHRYALWVLAFVSFAESSVFPIPPIPLLIPMCLARPKRAWYYASVCAIASTLGGVVGYGIGHLLYETVGLWIINAYGLQEKAAEYQSQYYQDIWMVILITKGLTPIPFKLVTIVSGLISFPFWKFMLGSLIARFTFFMMLAVVMRLFGDQVRNFIEKQLKLATFILVFFLVGGFVLLRYV